MNTFFSCDKNSKRAIFLFVIFYIGFGTWVTIFQEKRIYRPSVQNFDDCAAFRSDTKIRFGETRAYFGEVSEKLAVLYHGNAGSACEREYWAAIFRENGYSSLIVEYEGYSNDEKAPSHEGIQKNVHDVIAFIASRQWSEVVVVGESIGSGPASLHASVSPPRKVLLVTPFSDLKDLARSIFWYYPTSRMVNNAFDNVNALKDFSGSVLIIHGENDEVIPQKFGRVLFETLGSKDKKFVSVPESRHNDIFVFEETRIAIHDFLKLSEKGEILK